MSTSVELKLLTLLNVSAIKRPREADQPGAQRRSISVSPSVQPNPQSSTAVESSTEIESTEEPPRKKKRGVSFGGEVGPSGSGALKKGKTHGKKAGVAAKENASRTEEAQRQSESLSIPTIEEEVSEGEDAHQLIADEDTDDEGKQGKTTSMTGESDRACLSAVAQLLNEP
jgi:U3 small nucleolar RNA-associated protein 25